MSNGDDVLDNWEEIDEVGLNNTLQKIEAVRQTKTQQPHPQQLSKQNNISTDGSHSFDSADNSTFSSSKFSSSAATTNTSSNSEAMKLLQRTPTQDSNSSNSSSSAALKSPLDDMAASFQPVMMVLHKSDDEYQSANYTPPTKSQTVKILRRPTQSEPRNNGMKPRQPIKSLQQREQEYAEARLRILGAAKNPEDDLSGTATPFNNSFTSMTAAGNATPIARVNSSPKFPTSSGANVYNNHYQQQQPQQQQQQQNYCFSQPAYNNRQLLTSAVMQQQQHQHQPWPTILEAGSLSSSSSSSSLQRQPFQLQQQPESVMRMPRGPDGSTGFQTRR